MAKPFHLNFNGVFGPSETEVVKALLSGRRFVGYRWGTIIVLRNEGWLAFSWMVWPLAIVLFLLLVYFLG